PIVGVILTSLAAARTRTIGPIGAQGGTGSREVLIEVVGEHAIGQESSAGESELIGSCRLAGLDEAVGRRIVIPDLVVRFFRSVEELVADAEVQSPPRMESPGVLGIEGDRVGIESAFIPFELLLREVEGREEECLVRRAVECRSDASLAVGSELTDVG